jgi:lipid A 3-O-deacylase
MPPSKQATRRLRLWLAMSVAIGTVAASVPACAGEGLVSEIKLGALYHDMPGLWSNFQLEQTSVDPNLEILFRPMAQWQGGMIRPAVGTEINLRGDTSKAYADLRLQFDVTRSFYVALGFGAAIHDGTLAPTDPNRKALGARVLFHPSAEIGLNLDTHNNVSVYFDHMSNGDTATYNEGMDELGVRYGYRF